MALVEHPPSSSIIDNVLDTETLPPFHFNFDNYLNRTFPALSQPSKVTRPICQDYKQNRCPRGAECPDRHYVPKDERTGIHHLICKHFQRGLCKKGDKCEYAHTFNLRDERECKEFSRYGMCPQGEDCTYLHVPPDSPLRAAPCPHYKRGFCPLGPYCALRHVKHPNICPLYLAGFCPNGRAAAPSDDRVISCAYGAHARWVPDDDLSPRKPEPRKIKDPETLRREQEEREESFYAEEERRREKAEREGTTMAGRWSTRGRMPRGRGGFPRKRG